MLIKQVISGGQTGADQAALVAAKNWGIETGGWMPKGFMTQEGLCPSFAEEYGLWEHTQSDYKYRTGMNVWRAEATLRFARDWRSAGELCTLNFIEHHDRPHMDVGVPESFNILEFLMHPTPPWKVADWIFLEGITRLNVAGNSEKTAPGIANFVEAYMDTVFKILSEK